MKKKTDNEIIRNKIVKYEKITQETCGFCETHCGNSWCVTKSKEWKKKKKLK